MKKIAIIFNGGTISMKIDEKIKAAVPSLSADRSYSHWSGLWNQQPKKFYSFLPHFCASPAHLFLWNLLTDTAQGKPKFPLSKSKYVREENHSLTAPILTPFTKYFCRKGYSAMKGRIAHTIAA